LKLGERRSLRLAIVLLLLASGLLVQLQFLRTYPQPILFGDPGAYHRVGMKLRESFSEWRSGASFADAYASFRPYAYLVGTGAIYAAVDAIRGAARTLYESAGGTGQPEWLRPLPFFRVAWALINTLGMLGSFLLAKRLSGSFLGGCLALLAAAIYPSFSTQSGRLFPDPVFSTLFVWSAYAFVRAVQASSIPWMAAAGFLLGAGFFARAQFMNYFTILIGLALVASAPFWIREARARFLTLAFVLSVLPSVILWRAIVRDVGSDLGEVERFGFFAFPQQQQYPYGFWMFLDSDGWVGPYQLKEYPFYKAMLADREQNPGILGDRKRQIAFTMDYVASRFGEAVLLVLDNVYRLFDRPANDYQWDYPFAIRYQVLLQRVLVVLAVAGIAAFTLERRSLALVFFVPAVLCAVYGLSTPKPRYGQPAMFLFIALAGALVAALAARRRQIAEGWRRRPLAIGVFVLAGAGLLLGFVSRSSFPEPARFLRAVSALALLGVPFLLVFLAFARRSRDGLVVGAAWAAIALVTAAHLIRDPSWHETRLTLGRSTTGVEQEILLSSGAVNQLRSATQSFVLFDIHAPSGELGSARIRISERTYSGADLFPAMPPMGESTTAGGRNPRRYRQWWALPLSPDALPSSSGSLTVSLIYEDGSPLSLFGDRFRDAERVYDGPSFGDWPHVAAPKLEYDGDYRLPVRRPLASQGSRSFRLERDGTRRAMKEVLRIRIVSLASNEAHFSWRSAPRGKARAKGVAFYAYSQGNASADLFVDEERTLSFPLASEEDFEIREDGYRLCHRAQGTKGEHAYGAYVLAFPAQRSDPATLLTRYRSGMSLRPLLFSLDPEGDPAALVELAEQCGLQKREVVVDGAEIVSASSNSYPEDTGRWSVAEVY
jgi:4-amino-4-deoxy-L-arabinose transferase-like glycosyltransferase